MSRPSAKTVLFHLEDDLANWFPPYSQLDYPHVPPHESETSLQMSNFTHATFVDPMVFHPAHRVVENLLRRHPTQPIPSQVKFSWKDSERTRSGWSMISTSAVYFLAALHGPAEVLPPDVPPDRRLRKFAMIKLEPFNTFDALVSDLRRVEEEKKKKKNKNNGNNNLDEGTSITSPGISRFEPAAQKWLKYIADVCLSLRINHAALTDHMHLIMLVFPAMDISQDSSSAPGQPRSPGAHGGTFSVSIVSRSREKPVAYAG
ncbi:hypothetical protein BDP81DRAFT_504849 [Colletotrichum phormii]|uniref:Uncharacterized protein n=1 Tax=Colletotrichum phormii TaxID=359342 RepID=A0AAJ0A077_9PEZI|nr:uncharacterized protein BDP81DRAFT_504849 [Colletotrichum phormii]KAK1641443.1 hypothetical protein BDP81DRAFT_504849 [Colletotrichum phormii]